MQFVVLSVFGIEVTASWALAPGYGQEKNNIMVDVKEVAAEGKSPSGSTKNDGEGGNLSLSQMKRQGINRYIIVVILCLYCLISGPAYFNWTAIADALLQDGAFEWECSAEERARRPVPPEMSYEPRCKKQEMAVNSLFTVASSSHFFCSFLGGLLLDLLGAKLTGMIGTGVMFSGWILLAFSSETFRGYTVAAVLIGLSVDTAFFPCLTAANLFPGRGSTVIAFLGCFRSLSFVVPLAIRAAVIQGRVATATQALLVYSGLFLSLCFLVAAFLLPRRAFPKQEKETASAQVPDKETPKKALSATKTRPEVTDSSPSPPGDRQQERGVAFILKGMRERLRGLMKEGCSLAYLPLLPLFSFLLTNIIFYVPSALHLLPKAYEANQIIQTFSFLPCPLLGMLADCIGILPVMHMTNLCGVLAYVCVVIPSVPSYAGLQYLSSILFAIQISFLMSQLYCYVSITFSQENLGRLVGLVCAVGGLFSLVTGPMRSYALANGFLSMCRLAIALGCINALIIGFLHYLFYKRETRKQQIAIADRKATDALSLPPSAV